MKRLALGIVIGGIVGAILILLIIFIVDTNRRQEQQGLRLETNDSTATDPKKQQILVYGDYMDLDSTDFLLIPLGMKTVDNADDKNLRSKSSEEYVEYVGSSRSFKYNFFSLDFGNCNNIIFYNKVKESSHLLLQHPAIISKFYFPHYNKEYTGNKYYFILVGIREDDTNADGYLNDEDAERVYITDLDGRNKIQVTPDNTQLVDWFIDPATNSVLMKVRFDSNGDHKFTAYDSIDILKTSIDSPAKAKAIIGDDIKFSITKILKKIK
jgi:hypothetical protein